MKRDIQHILQDRITELWTIFFYFRYIYFRKRLLSWFKNKKWKHMRMISHFWVLDIPTIGITKTKRNRKREIGCTWRSIFRSYIRFWSIPLTTIGFPRNPQRVEYPFVRYILRFQSYLFLFFFLVSRVRQEMYAWPTNRD